MMFFSQYFSFHCQYHSTNAPYSLINLQPMLYDVFLPVFQYSTCQYHSTNVPYSFIHLPTNPYDVSLPVLQVCPVSIIPTMLHTYSFIYHRRYMMFFSQYFSFHCHNRSTNAPYSFIQLPPTLYDVFLLILQFPLSVSFHQCSILIHSTTTDAIWCFSPSTSVSPVSIIPPIFHTHSFIYHRRCTMFFSKYVSFHCQYHSTNAPYTLIYLPPTLYNVVLPVLQFSPHSLFPSMLHTLSFTYHRRNIMFFSQYFNFALSV